MDQGSGWQAWAAGIGALLGVVNLIRALRGDRPVFHLAPYIIGGEPHVNLAVINLARRPLLIRRMMVYPREISPHDPDENAFDRTGLRQTWFHMTERRFAVLIPSEGKRSINLNGLKRSGWCVIFVTWMQRGTLFPWSLVIARRSLLRDLCDAVLPKAD